MLPDFIEALLDPRSYTSQPEKVDLVQTHISYVLLASDHVYKIKKPVSLGFLDFSSLEKRKFYCEEEVRLNSRLCPDLYYGIEPVVRAAGGFCIGRDGEPVEYAIHMKRLPAERMMDALIERDGVSFEMIGRVASAMVEFHERSESDARLLSIGGYDAFVALVRENFDQIEPFVGQTISRPRFDALRRFMATSLERDEALLRKRQAEGRIKDGHGDLRCESVCFDFPAPGDVCISDCIEFGEAYRVADIGLDIGFLAMDLDARGRPDLSDLLIGLYCAAAGDVELPLVLAAFKTYRATVRGKVKSLQAAGPEMPPEEAVRARAEAERYFAVADGYTERATQPLLVLVRGLSGSGKSVLAGALAARLGAALVSTDVTRKRLFGGAPTKHERTDYGAGIYTPEASDRVYGALAASAGSYLASGHPAVLDGTYLTATLRAAPLAGARATGTPALVVECLAPDAVVAERQRTRADQQWSTSDGSWETYLKQKEAEEPVTASEGACVVVETTRPLAEQLDLVLRAISDL